MPRGREHMASSGGCETVASPSGTRKIEMILYDAKSLPVAVIKQEAIEKLLNDGVIAMKDKAKLVDDEKGARIGNPPGLQILDKLHHVDERFQELESELRRNKTDSTDQIRKLQDALECAKTDSKQEIKTLRTTLESNKTKSDEKIATLEAGATKLKDISRLTLEARSRFFSIYIRDKRPDLWKKYKHKERRIINAGDAAVHWGDPITDAHMLEENVRDGIYDTGIYRDLYGLDHDRVLSLRNDKKTIETLKMHASYKTVKGYDVPASYDEAFTKFIDAFVRSGLSHDYPRPVEDAYNKFRAEHETVGKDMEKDNNIAKPWIARFGNRALRHFRR